MHHFSRLFMSSTVMVLVLSRGTLLADTPERYDPTPAFAAMAARGEAYINDPTDCPGAISAMALHDNLDLYTVIDLRSESTFLAGHIPGACHSSLGTVLQDMGQAIPTHKPLVVVDYTGQTAAMVKFLLEMAGYEDTKFLKFGMSAWSQTTDYWTASVGNNLSNPETENQNGNLTTHAFPVLEGDPATIVPERLAAMQALGFRGVSYSQIADSLEDYFIINYFSQQDYEGMGISGVPGHIPGAFQFTPCASLGLEQMLENIPPDMPVVFYDWDGMHSAQVVTYLNMLGYDAYSLKYGANGLFYDALTSHRWQAPNDFPLEMGPQLTPVLPAPEGLLADGGCHPNPFNPMTEIHFSLGAPAAVSVEVYDLYGRQVAGLLRDEYREAGAHFVTFTGQDSRGRHLAAGTYLYRLKAGTEVRSGRMQLIK